MRKGLMMSMIMSMMMVMLTTMSKIPLFKVFKSMNTLTSCSRRSGSSATADQIEPHTSKYKHKRRYHYHTTTYHKYKEIPLHNSKCTSTRGDTTTTPLSGSSATADQIEPQSIKCLFNTTSTSTNTTSTTITSTKRYYVLLHYHRPHHYLGESATGFN